jgi:hypothetical protein
MGESERGLLGDKIEVAVVVEQQRVRVHGYDRDQAVHESPDCQSRSPATAVDGSGLFVVREAAELLTRAQLLSDRL